MTPERDDLTVVERRIRAAKEYIYQQERLIERLADEANNTGDAFALLNILNRALRLFERYQLLLDRLGGRDAGDHSRHRVRHPAVVNRLRDQLSRRPGIVGRGWCHLRQG